MFARIIDLRHILKRNGFETQGAERLLLVSRQGPIGDKAILRVIAEGLDSSAASQDIGFHGEPLSPIFAERGCAIS
ncbi:MAG: hypothetical protein A2133_05225 [Actinobacteria bacterium RBG_16_64_13]|nr:MAG: hypothetical protein A2133_05225 [Actinobacteria bacterium RBG_16_64_13]